MIQSVFEVYQVIKFYFLKIWPQLEWNLYSEAIGVFVEVILVTFIINRILKKRDKEREIKRWKPVRGHIVKYVLVAYRSLFDAAQYSMHSPADLPDLDFRRHFINDAEQHLELLEKKIEINNAALDAFLANNIYKFIEEYEAVIDRLKYQLKLFNPEFKNYDIVSSPSFHHLNKIQKIIDSFREKYPEEFDKFEPKIKTSHDVTLESIKEKWRKLEEETDRLCFNPNGYQYSEGQTPLLYDNMDSYLLMKNENFDQEKGYKMYTMPRAKIVHIPRKE